MPRGLKTVFLIHAIVALLFGIVAFVRPVYWVTWFAWTRFDPVMTRGYGAALLALAVASWLGYRAAAWSEVRIIVQMEIAFTVLSTVGGLWALLFRHGPAFLWVGIVLWVAFAIAWIVCYARATSRTAREAGSQPAVPAP
jgi:hypothetical protein